MKLRVLQLCHKPPYPPIDGGCIAMNTVTNGLLASGCDVKILTIETPKHHLDRSKLPSEYAERTKIESVFVDTSINIVDAFSSLITSDSYNISRFFSPDFDRKLIEVLHEQKFDIIHLESLFMSPYIQTLRRATKAKIVLRSHNLEYIIWENLAKGTKNLPKKTYLNILSKQLKKYEINILKEVDGIAAISSEDFKKYLSLKSNKPIINIPFGVDLKDYTPDRSTIERKSLFHLGAMDWAPNVEGVDWFIQHVWPKVRAADPDIKFYLAGKAVPEKYLNMEKDNIFCIGEVKDAKAFIRSKEIMIVPLLSAGGIRVKIIEGMALEKCIISTKTGADGIDYKNEVNIHIAEDADDFAKKISVLINNEALIKQTESEARALAENKYDNKLLTRDLLNFYYSIID